MPHNFPYPVIRVPTCDALREVQARRKHGCVPIILGSEEQFQDLANSREESWQAEPHEIRAYSADFDGDVWARHAVTCKEAKEVLEEFEWPRDARPVTALWALNGESQDVKQETVIALLPTTDCWMAPCLLKVGGFNSSPGAQWHAAIAKYWHQRYGAEMVAVVGDTVEFTVSNPPRTESEALELALQQYRYCDDHVCQNHYSFGEFVASLHNATVWSFWWD